jgi:hypothetical protein
VRRGEKGDAWDHEEGLKNRSRVKIPGSFLADPPDKLQGMLCNMLRVKSATTGFVQTRLSGFSAGDFEPSY